MESAVAIHRPEMMSQTQTSIEVLLCVSSVHCQAQTYKPTILLYATYMSKVYFPWQIRMLQEYGKAAHVLSSCL